jgi:hypothetical protein
METYKFSIPTRINYIVDDSTISIDTIEDVEEIEDMYCVDLDFVVEEYEYKLDVEKNSEDDEDYYGMDEDDIFSDIISENWNKIIKKLNKEYKLDDLTDEEVNRLFEITKEDFEKNVLINKFEQFNLSSIWFNSFSKTKSEFYVTVEVDKKLKKDEIEDLRTWIEIQTSENWGENFSKIDLSDKLKKEDVYVYLLPWSLKKDVKYVK